MSSMFLKDDCVYNGLAMMGDKCERWLRKACVSPVQKLRCSSQRPVLAQWLSLTTWPYSNYRLFNFPPNTTLDAQ